MLAAIIPIIDPKGRLKPINAKSETPDRLPMFRDAYRGGPTS
jgi:hypothetical protein